MNASLQRALRRTKSKSHPCAGGCGQPVSGNRMACLRCTVDGFVEEQERSHPDIPVHRAAIAAFVVDHPEVNRQ